MNSILLSCLICFATLAGAATSEAAQPDVAPVRSDHYRGKWLEIARTPMFITDGCVAGFTVYRPGRRENEVEVLDGCHQNGPKGKLKTIHGKGQIIDWQSTKAKLRVRYPFLITFDYWVLYTAADGSWFISADPQLKNLWIYSRRVPDRKKLAKMVRRAALLGYDVRRLEFPAQ